MNGNHAPIPEQAVPRVDDAATAPVVSPVRRTVHGRPRVRSLDAATRVIREKAPRLPLVGSMARNMAFVGAATAIGQAAVVLAAPVLSRLYDPRDFGLLSVYAAVLSVLVSIASLRFDFAITISGDGDEALHLLVVSIAVAAAFAVATALAVGAWGNQLAAALGAAQLSSLLWLLPVAVLVAGAAQALSQWAVYHRRFPELGRMRATQGVSQALVQTAFGLVHAGPIGLLAGDVVGRVFGVDHLARSLLKGVRAAHIAPRAVTRYARERWGFARVMTAASLLSALSLQVPFLLIPALFDLSSSGQYFFAYRVLVLPATLVGAAVSQVFFGEATFRRSRPEELHALARTVTLSLFALSVPTYAIAAAGGPVLFAVVFGAQWTLAGTYTQIMAPWLVLWSVASPISSLLLVGRRERESLMFTAAELTLRAASLGLGGLLHSLTAGLIVLSCVSALLNISALWRFLRVASVRLRDLIRPVAVIIALTLPGFAIAFASSVLVPVTALAACAVGWAVSVALVLQRSTELRALLGSHD